MKRRIQISTMVLGIVLAAAVVCSNVFQINTETGLKKESNTAAQQTEKSDNDFSFNTAPTTTPPASAHVHSNLLAYLIFEIQQPQVKVITLTADHSVYQSKLLLTLFRVIISPNAP